MRAYVVTTGAVFGLLVIVHLWRIAEEGAHAAGNPWFLLVTVISAALSVWAWRLARKPA
jgi:hypothetical protein